MRHRTVIIAGLLILIVIGIGLVLFLPKGPQQTAQSVPSAITVTSLQSDVFLKQSGPTFVPVTGQAITTSGSTIKTSSTGRALIASSNSHTTLIDYSSEITLNESAGSRTSVGLLAGAVWSRLQKTFDSGEYYEIKSGNAVATVRGTSFGVWYVSGTTTLIVTDGSVLFSAIDPATGLPISGTEVLVTAGHKAVRSGNGKIVVSESSKEDLALPWVIFNTDRNAPTAASSPSSGISPNSTTGQQPPATGATTTVQVPPPSTPPSQPTTDQPTLAYVSPSKAAAGSRVTITLKGNNLLDVSIVEIDSTRVSFTVVNAATITFTSENIGAGTYDIMVSTRKGKTATLSRALTLTAPSGVQKTSPNSPNTAQ